MKETIYIYIHIYIFCIYGQTYVFFTLRKIVIIIQYVRYYSIDVIARDITVNLS